MQSVLIYFKVFNNMFNKLFPCCKFGEGRASHRGGDQKLLIRRNQRLRRYTETERSIKKLKSKFNIFIKCFDFNHLLHSTYCFVFFCSIFWPYQSGDENQVRYWNRRVARNSKSKPKWSWRVHIHRDFLKQREFKNAFITMTINILMGAR